MNFLEALQYPIIQNAVFAGLLASIACGIMGTYIVVKRLVFITGGISHASFGGIGFAFWAGIEPLLGAMLFAVASAFGIGALGKETLKREDTAIGIIWVIGMALGSFFMYFTPGYAVNLSSYLFGSLTLITEMDLYFLIVLDIVLIAFTLIFFRQLQALCFDEEFAKITGVPTTLLYFTLLGLAALTVVLLIKFVGIILVIALITIPAAISLQFTYRLRTMMIISTILGIVFTVGGLWISFEMDWTTGSTIVLLAGAVFVLVTLGKKTVSFAKKKLTT